MLSRLGIELRSQDGPARPITRPPINLPDLDDRAIEAETREAQSRVRVIRAGRDAWEAVAKAESFEGWLAIGAALSVGRRHALKVTQANAPMGRRYSREFNLWIKAHGFDRMPAATRSIAIELAENIEAIETWRATLPEKRRRRLVHPLSNVARWKAATAHNGKCPTDLHRAAVLAGTGLRLWLEHCRRTKPRPYGNP
jgi:hypothetical protein